MCAPDRVQLERGAPSDKEVRQSCAMLGLGAGLCRCEEAGHSMGDTCWGMDLQCSSDSLPIPSM